MWTETAHARRCQITGDDPVFVGEACVLARLLRASASEQFEHQFHHAFGRPNDADQRSCANTTALCASFAGASAIDYPS
jgi:hypothetical protein